ncbi:cGMP-dependent 3',5'-cyclic phosphodiesterase isoform X2 [Halyomorpha halys]|nr:cGMP-dependent 3',5'-cyclic phosphodiesterase isoform X2 [Halyomorpha halys]XP_024217186.1 cGMP-dependent 3',5'-cyclic phosphodiesterase isoform X2 [Halyomorpha halys]
MKPLDLRYCDSGALFTLLSTLGNLEASKLHTKVNQYFLETLGCIGIIMEYVSSSHCTNVRAIGRVVLSEPLKFQHTCNLLQMINEAKGPIRIEKGQLEGELYCYLNKVLREEYKERFSNCMFFPIEHPLEKEKYTHFFGLVNFKDFEGCEDIYNGIVTECFRHCYGMLRSACNYEEEKQNSNQCTVILNSFIEILSWAGTNMVYDKVQQQSMKLMDAAKCSVFIHDPEFNLVAKAFAGGKRPASKEAHEKEGKVLSYTTTASKVAHKRKLLHIPSVADDPFYSSINNLLTDDCRNLLSFPMILSGNLLGVIEVYDKNPPSLTFTEEDMALSLHFSTTTACAIKANKMFYHFHEIKSKQQFTDCVLLRRFKDLEVETVKSILNCHHKHNFKRVTDFRFDPRVVPDKHVLCVCLKIFEGSGLLNKFKIKRETFVRFLLKVKEAHSAVPFHNWDLAFLTFHFVFICINQYNLIKDGYVTIFEYFTLLMAALCHGLDHRGPTSMFEMASGSVLASLYSSPGSISQRHHLSQALRIMTYPECNILQHIDNEEFYLFAVLLGNMIQDTNMAFRPQKKLELEELMENGFDCICTEHRRLFQFLIINCAQTCYSCKPWPLCRKIGEDAFQEFFRKGDLEQAQGVFEINDFNEDILKLPEMNCHFIETVCIPNFRLLAQICPLVYLCVLRIEINLGFWKEEKDKIMATMAKDLGDDSVEEEEDNFFR